MGCGIIFAFDEWAMRSDGEMAHMGWGTKDGELVSTLSPVNYKDDIRVENKLQSVS